MNYGAVMPATTREILGARSFSAIVDINGVFNAKTGGFHVVDDAIDAGHKSIFVRDGTYPPFDADVANLRIVGESWDVIIDGGTTGDAIDITALRVSIENLSAQTTGGQGNSYEAFEFGVGADGSRAFHCRVIDADNDAFHLLNGGGANVRIEFCEVITADAICVNADTPGAIITGNLMAGGTYGVYGNEEGDNLCATGNHFKTVTGSVILVANCENCLVVGNIGDTAFTNNSGTSTMANNEEY